MDDFALNAKYSESMEHNPYLELALRKKTLSPLYVERFSVKEKKQKSPNDSPNTSIRMSFQKSVRQKSNSQLNISLQQLKQTPSERSPVKQLYDQQMLRLSQRNLNHIAQSIKQKLSINDSSHDNSQSFSEQGDKHEFQVAEPNKVVKRKTLWQKTLKLIINHWVFIILIALATIYALFFDDIRILGFQKQADQAFYGITVGVFFLFTFEIVVQSFISEGYFLSFFFWLDIISTLSLIPDIGWLTDYFETQLTKKASQITKTSRAARVTRIIRIVRIIRLIRIVKLYKQAKIAESVKKDKEAQELERKIIEEVTLHEQMYQEEIMLRKRASQLQKLSEDQDELMAQLPPDQQIQLNRRTSLLPLLMRNDSIIKRKELLNPSLQQYATQKLFIEACQEDSEDSNSMEEASCEESRQSNPQGDKSQEDDQIEDFVPDPSEDQEEKSYNPDEQSQKNEDEEAVQMPRFKKKSGNQLMIPTSKKSKRRQSAAVQFAIPIQPPVGGMRKSFKKSVTMQKSDNKRRESGFTDSTISKGLSSKMTDKVIQGSSSGLRRFLTMAMKSNVDEASADNIEQLPALSYHKKATSEVEKESNYFFEDKIDKLKESKLAKQFTDRITKSVLIVILGMLFMQPLFEYDSYYSDQTSYQFAIDELVSIHRNYYTDQIDADEFEISFKKLVSFHENSYNPLLYIQVEGAQTYQVDYLANVRNSDQSKVYAKADKNSFIIYDISKMNRIQSYINISRTVFIMILIATGIILLNNDINVIVIEPIERLTEKVRLMAANPLGAMNGEIDRQGVLNVIGQQQEGKKDQLYETYILEQAFKKIGQLLALGFGEAGAQIIASNIKQQGDINFKSTGQKVLAIFGFCDIRNFTDATETLQTEVMVFVNKIAEIVHSQVDKYLGAANKNIGDAFLLVWKFPDDLILRDDLGHMSLSKESKKVSIIADLALFSFLKIIAKINKLQHIVEYSRNKDLRERIPDYKVRMGFGLHFGWAIEGAIGSEFKIDASYLSPNVNIAARLEAATKQYGVQILISGDFIDLLSDKVKLVTREIDTVTVKGSVNPIKLFTITIQQISLQEIIDRFVDLDPLEKKKQRQQEKKAVIKRLYGEIMESNQLYYRDSDIRELRKYVDADLERTFKKAYTAYIDGDWDKAKKYIDRCLGYNPGDGPTLTLKQYIDSEKGHPPVDWRGFRELLEK